MTTHLTVGDRAMMFDSDDWILQTRLNAEGTKQSDMLEHVRKLARRDARQDVYHDQVQPQTVLATFPPAYRRSYSATVRRLR